MRRVQYPHHAIESPGSPGLAGAGWPPCRVPIARSPPMEGMPAPAGRKRKTTGIITTSATAAKASHAAHRCSVARRITVYPSASSTRFVVDPSCPRGRQTSQPQDPRPLPAPAPRLLRYNITTNLEPCRKSPRRTHKRSGPDAWRNPGRFVTWAPGKALCFCSSSRQKRGQARSTPAAPPPETNAASHPVTVSP